VGVSVNGFMHLCLFLLKLIFSLTEELRLRVQRKALY